MLGALLASAIASQPSPSPPPLKTIIHVRSSAFCTTLRENVGHAVRALIQNNVAIDGTKSLFLKMARDKVSSANRIMSIDMDINHLGPMIDEIAQNLAAAQALLNDARHFPTQPRSEDERRLAQMQKQLRAIIDHQNQALNILSGTYYSYNGNRLMGHGDGLKTPVDSPNDTPIVMPPTNAKDLTNASPAPLPTASQLPAVSPLAAATPASLDLGLLGMTKFAALFNRLTTYQLNEEPLEAQAAATILQSSAECNGSQ
jgi:hypothetical protein